MSSNEIREKFLAFFESRGHTIVPSSSLIPDDKSVMLTTAGMQQFKKYFTGELNAQTDFRSLNTTSVQKSFRTSDIDEVGDDSHLTFFEMLGNFSFGGYFKKEAIQYGYDFITKEMGLTIDYVSVFKGETGVPADEESEQIWKAIDPDIEIKRFGREDNFWGPTGVEGPCGPTTEIYIDGVEIWNIVFNQYYQSPDGTLKPLKTPGVDTGMGLERLAMVLQGVQNIFETDLFGNLIELIPDVISMETRRVAADHARGVSFLLADGVRPSNKEEGYILRKLMRRIMVHEYIANDPSFDIEALLKRVVELYGDIYKGLDFGIIKKEYNDEDKRFINAMKRGLKELEKTEIIDSKGAFRLYESYGLPYEIIKEIGKEKAASLNREEFEIELEKHREISRAGKEAKFGGHGIYLKTGEVTVKDKSELEKVTRLHTATHLLHSALRSVLGDEVQQNGSDITVDRTRFDFSFPRKVTTEELKQIEDLVNEIIQKGLPVTCKEMPIEEAKKTGALHFFSSGGGSAVGGKERYPENVKVYYMGDTIEDAFSKEFCGGPHVANTKEVGKFKILKEQSAAAGVRRIRAIVTS